MSKCVKTEASFASVSPLKFSYETLRTLSGRDLIVLRGWKPHSIHMPPLTSLPLKTTLVLSAVLVFGLCLSLNCHRNTFPLNRKNPICFHFKKKSNNFSISNYKNLSLKYFFRFLNLLHTTTCHIILPVNWILANMSLWKWNQLQLIWWPILIFFSFSFFLNVNLIVFILIIVVLLILFHILFSFINFELNGFLIAA